VSRIMVVNRNGDKVFDRTREEITRMLAEHQVRRTAISSVYQLIGFTPAHEHPCRTHTSRGGPLGGQLYTTKRHGQVDGYKRIFLEDLGTFNAATLDCTVGHWRVISITMQSGQVVDLTGLHCVVMEAKAS
jgi:hypothetical protein